MSDLLAPLFVPVGHMCQRSHDCEKLSTVDISAPCQIICRFILSIFRFVRTYHWFWHLSLIFGIFGWFLGFIREIMWILELIDIIIQIAEWIINKLLNLGISDFWRPLLWVTINLPGGESFSIPYFFWNIPNGDDAYVQLTLGSTGWRPWQ